MLKYLLFMSKIEMCDFIKVCLIHNLYTPFSSEAFTITRQKISISQLNNKHYE